LLQGCIRLDVIEHNTYIAYGFRNGTYINKKDVESEDNTTCTTFVANFDIQTKADDSFSTSNISGSTMDRKKRKHEDEELSSHSNTSQIRSSKKKILITMTSQMQIQAHCALSKR
jgi:hypothetical protein